jgi:hypothetical protein
MRTINILTLTRLHARDREMIEAVDPGVRLTDAAGWFDGEYRDTWPESVRSGMSCSPRRRSFSAVGPIRSTCARDRRS